MGPVDGNELLEMLDWLLGRQTWIERTLARRHLQQATLILYDVSSSCREGPCGPLAAVGHNRDGKQGKQQFGFGLLCSAEGCPIAVEVFAGNPADPTTAATQVSKLQKRFGIDRIAVVGDRGMLTSARIREDLQPAGLAWISALKTSDLRKLARTTLKPATLVPDTVAEITSPDFPDERLLVCLNPWLLQERRREREDRLQATEQILEGIATAVLAGRLSGAAAIGRRIGREANRYKVAKLFAIDITEEALHWRRDEHRIEDEARFDGIYIVRSSLEAVTPDAAVQAYKSLASVERAFRNTKSHLGLRPVYVHTTDHVRAHAFLCMLSYYIEWHMRRSLVPLLCEDDDQPSAQPRPSTPVAGDRTSPSADRKDLTKQMPDARPVHSFRTLLDDLSSVMLNTVRLAGSESTPLTVVTRPTPLQRRAFSLLEVNPDQEAPLTAPGREPLGHATSDL